MRYGWHGLAFLGAYFGHSSGSSRPKSTPRRHSAEVGLAHRRRVEGQHFVETALSSAKSSPGVPHARGHPQSIRGYKVDNSAPCPLLHLNRESYLPGIRAIPTAVTMTTIPVRSWLVTTISPSYPSLTDRRPPMTSGPGWLAPSSRRFNRRLNPVVVPAALGTGRIVVGKLVESHSPLTRNPRRPLRFLRS